MIRKRNAAVLVSGTILGALAYQSASSAADKPHYVFAMVSHGQAGDSFWDIIRKGAEAAAAKDNVKLVYLTDSTASGESKLLVNVTQQHVDGVALTLAFPAAMESAVKQTIAANIPIVGFNAGTDNWKQAGLMAYVGVDNHSAGMAVGNQLNAEGATDAICINPLQGAVQLEARSNGIKDAFHGKFSVVYTPGYDMAAAQSRLVAKLQQDPKIDYVVTLGAPFAPTALTAVGMSGHKAKVGTFDLTPVAAHLIQQGKLQWAVDQQPFVQGYEAIDLLWLYKTNGNVVGGGQAVLTGPAFVTKSNIDMVSKFANAGTR
jgi:simple sugar transport system substrate-binding protein